MKKVIIGSMVLLSACAKHAKDIPAQYVSPLEYNSYSCKQIERELGSLSRKVSELGGQVDKTASNDAAQMGVGLILFWPVLFALDGDTPQAAEYGRLKGEFDALEKVANQKNCDIKIEHPVAAKPEAKETKADAYPKSRR